MAVATGTALLIGSALAAGGTAGGAALSSRASNRATEAGLDANTQAIEYQKQREAEERAMAEKQWAAYQAGRQALLQRYGVDVDLGGGAPAGPPGAVPRGGTEMPQGAPIQRGQGLSIAQSAQPRGEWNDWARYGLRR